MQDLLDLALDQPAEARRRAEDLLAGAPTSLERSFAWQALGIVVRERGRTQEATRLLRRAMAAAIRSGDGDRVRDVGATLGATLAFGGQTAEALRVLEQALDGATGELAAKIALRKGVVLALAGRDAEAIPVLRRAIAGMQSVGNRTWEARSRVWLAACALCVGQVGTADTEIEAAMPILLDEGAATDLLAARANHAEIAIARGDLATGLRRYEEALVASADVGSDSRLEAVLSYASAYLAAGLPKEAVALLVSFPGDVGALRAAAYCLTHATALLAADEPRSALEAAGRARAMLRRQDRSWYAWRARLTMVRARHALGEVRGLARESEQVAQHLHEEGADEAPVALTLAGRLAKGEERRELWRQAASYRNHPNALVRASAWLARALEREDAGDRGGALRACRAGLDAIDEQRRLLGSSELRAQATTHGRELTEVALRAAATDPRRLLGWAERTRATTLAQPRMTSDAATIPESLAALRDNGRQLAEARAAGEPTERLERERLRLERAVRAESHTVSAAGTDADRPATAEEVVAGVGDGCLVELVDVDGTLHVLVVHAGKVRRRIAGPTADALALLDPVAMLLRRSARGRPAATDQIGRRLQDAILGDAARLIPDGPVVLAPTTRLHGLPWAVLPALSDRPFSVVPSAGQWLRARAVRRPTDRRTVLVCGPGLESGGAEVPLLAEQHPAATLLTCKKATLDAVLGSIDGADLVHLAAHGHFRADSPLFSSLDLADGPLTVHDIERIGRAPYRVVLSACESGVLAPVGAQELLGLAAALFGLGTAGLVCSVAEVNDAATADLMVRLHAGLAAGKDPATALHEVRRDTTDPVASATASAFLALGV